MQIHCPRPVIAADDESDANSPTLLRLYEALGPEFAVLLA